METNTATKTDLTVANTIRDQIGSRALWMLGATQIVGDTNSLKFKVHSCKKVSHILITLAPDDTYTVTFYKKAGRFEFKTVAELEGVYVDMLHDVIQSHTGLYTRL